MLTAVKPYHSSVIMNAELTVWLGNSYKFFKHLTNKIIAVGLGFASLPFLYVLSFYLHAKRRGLIQQIRANNFCIQNADEYSLVKTKVAEYQKLFPHLKEMSNYKAKNSPFLLRYPVTQIINMSSMLVTYIEWLDSKAKSLNYFNNTTTTVFKLTTEQELWDRRNKAYQYWV